MQRFSMFWIGALALFQLVGCDANQGKTPPAQLKRHFYGTHKLTAKVPDIGNIKYTIRMPKGYDGKTPVPLVLMLHYGGGAQSESHIGSEMIEALGPGFDELNPIIIAPDALGGSWTSPQNERAAIWLTESAIQTYNVDQARVLITGFSMGGEGTWYIGSRHQDLFTGAIPIAARVAEGPDWAIPLYVIHSADDQVMSFSAAKSHTEALKANGSTVEFVDAAGLTHYDTPAYQTHLPTAAKWMSDQWQQPIPRR